jgi:hypothetical protein
MQLLSITLVYWILIHALVVPIARYMIPALALLMLGTCVRVDRMRRRQQRVAPHSTLASGGAV